MAKQKEIKRIVVAWTEMTGFRPTGGMVMRDLNWFPEYEVCRVAKAAMWTNKGTSADIEKAEAYITTEKRDRPDIAVLVYPVGEKDPLGRAKREMLAI